ncbi:MAG TPA: Ig-like domain-containing protein, partial [Gemmataceae bacterium]|nr:Ig-like domain-containing protein [Gemmataceae bacterium]
SAPSGAGISIEDTATTTIFGTTIAGNSGSQGAGISNEGTLNLLSSTVSGNVSGGDGGGISIASPFTTRVSTSTIINNISAGRGGGIFNAGLQTDVYGSTITGNAAANNAGGIAIVAGSTLTLNNTIVAENTVTGVGSPNINGRVSQGSGNFIGVGDNNLTGITNGTNGNRIGNPLFPPLDPLLGPLQDNGGPTLTRAPLPGSPVINAGVTSIPSPTDLDQRGLLRIVGSAIDIGAVEFQPPGTSTTITVTPSAPVFGQSVTLSATVRPNSPPPNNTLTGTVTFFNGSTVLGAASVGTGGVASTTVPTPPPGASLYAVYSGDRNYQSSSSDATNPVVQLAPTSTVLTSVPLAVFGQTFTLSAAVSATPAVAGIVPTGTITFLNSGVPLGSVSVGSGGVATLTVAAPLAGTLSIQAAYSGDGNFQGSTSVAVASVVVRALTSTSLLSASPSPVVTGANLTLTAAVSATPALGDAAPTGTVTFLSGGVPLGSVPVDSSGVATLTVAAPLPGTLSVQASYSGDFNFGASTSSAIAVLVLDRPVSPPPPQIPRSQGQTSTSLTAPATVVLGGTFTLMATVAPSVPGAALTGTVNFSNDGTPLGTAAVGADGVATLTVAASFPGTLSLQAIYSGDADFQGSSSPPVAVRVSARSSVGAYDPATGIWSLRKSNSAGAPDGGQFAYGGPGTIGVSGDWDGDGITSIGIVEVDAATNTLVWKLRNTNSPGAPDIVVSYGGAGAIPVLGDWDGNGTVTIGVVEVDATTNTLVWKLRNSNSNGGPDIVLSYGGPGATPVVGDWDGDGTTTIGVTEIDPTANVLVWKLRNDNSPGGPNVPVFAYGGPGSVPVAADWDGDGKTTVGVFDTASAQWQLRNSNAPGAPDIAAFAFGVGTWSPVVGNWALPPVTPLPAAGAAHPVAAALEELGPAGIDSILVNQLAEAWAQLGSLPRGTLGQSLQADPLLLPGLP